MFAHVTSTQRQLLKAECGAQPAHERQSALNAYFLKKVPALIDVLSVSRPPPESLSGSWQKTSGGSRNLATFHCLLYLLVFSLGGGSRYWATFLIIVFGVIFLSASGRIGSSFY